MSVLRKTINLTLNGNRLVTTDSTTGNSTTDAGIQGENNAVMLHFAVPVDWNGLTVILYVTNEHRVYDKAAAVNGVAELPLQQSITKCHGKLFVHVEGCEGTDVRKTADCELFIKKSMTGGWEAAPITPTMQQQLLTLVAGAVQTVTGTGAAKVTRQGNTVNVDVSGTGGDMLASVYAAGTGKDNTHTVDHALYSDNLTKYIIGTGGMAAFQVAFINSANTIMAANAANASHAGRIVGILTAAGTAGETGTVKTSGAINNPAWNLTAGSIYYLGSGGEITATAPTVGFVQKIGVAQDATTLFVQIESPAIY